MDKTIYQLANEIEMDMEQYETDTISETEIRRIKKHVRKHSKRVSGKVKVAAAAAVLCLATGIMNSSEVYAFVEQVRYKITSIWGFNDVEKYMDVINTSQQFNGYTVTLNEVILDQDELIICQTIHSEEPIDYLSSPSSRLKINGAWADSGSSGESTLIDEYTQEEITNYVLTHYPLELNESYDILYEIPEFQIYDQTGPKTVKGNWSFRFTVTEDELIKDTVVYELNQQVTMPDGSTVVFDSYSTNPVSQKIRFHVPDEDGTFDYNMDLRGTDDKGNLVVFYLSSYDSRPKTGFFKPQDLENQLIGNEAEQLNLTLYVAKMPKESGRSYSPYEKYEETYPITFDLKK